MRSSIFETRPNPKRLKPAYGKTKRISWNLDDLISSYNESGALPPILSPTLPEFDPQTPRDRVLDDSDDDIPLSQLSMLSPTLPSIFDKRESSERAERGDKVPKKPKPEKADKKKARSTTSTPKLDKKKNYVRYVNKLDSERPRFLLRVNFDSIEKYASEMKKREEEEKSIKSDIKPVEKKDPKESNPLQLLEQKLVNRERQIQERERAIQREHEEASKLVERLRIEREELREKKLALLERETREKDDADRIDKENDKPFSPSKSNFSSPLKGHNGVSRTTPSLPQVPSLPQIPQVAARSEETNKLLQQKKTHWLQLSKTTRDKSKNAPSRLLSVIMCVDSFLMKTIAYDYDERSKIVVGVLPSERSWKNVVTELSDLITDLNISLPSIKEKNIGDFYKILVCILYQARATIYKRINDILIKVIDSYKKKKSDNLNGKIIELQQQHIDNNILIMRDYINCKPDYLSAIIPLKFPQSSQKGSHNLKAVQAQHDLADFSGSLTPRQNSFFLPLGVYSNLEEVVSLLYYVISEFIDIFNKYSGEGMWYKLLSER